jgi:hypothetical protein
MKSVFADTFYFLALLNERDAAHKRALRFCCLDPQSHSRKHHFSLALVSKADGFSSKPSESGGFARWLSVVRLQTVSKKHFLYLHDFRALAEC